jgi:hypothetical protein
MVAGSRSRILNSEGGEPPIHGKTAIDLPVAEPHFRAHNDRQRNISAWLMVRENKCKMHSLRQGAIWCDAHGLAVLPFFCRSLPYGCLRTAFR